MQVTYVSELIHVLLLTAYPLQSDEAAFDLNEFSVGLMILLDEVETLPAKVGIRIIQR
jgi:hypothetical protein